MPKKDPLFKVVRNRKSREFPIAVLVTVDFGEGMSKQLTHSSVNGAFSALGYRLGEVASQVSAEEGEEELDYDDLVDDDE